MTRYVAFLRAINVGGRNVSMSVLKREFEGLGLSDVDTFIASGNVIFSTRAKSLPSVELQIERALRKALRYDVSTFVRAESEVAAVARYRPFAEDAMRTALSVNVGFLAAPLSIAARRALVGLQTDIDTFHVHGREIYWMCQKRQSESAISNAVIERALKVRSTLRGLKTIVRLAERLGGPKPGEPR